MSRADQSSVCAPLPLLNIGPPIKLHLDKRASSDSLLLARRTLDADSPITDKLFRDIISNALQQLFGYIGGAVVLDILSVADAHATIRIDKRCRNRVSRHVTPPLKRGADALAGHSCALTACFA